MTDKKKNSVYFILAGLIVISFSISLLYFQIKPAVDFCRSVDGDYSISILKDKHFCDGESIVQWEERLLTGYEKGWDFEKNVDERNALNKKVYSYEYPTINFSLLESMIEAGKNLTE